MSNVHLLNEDGRAALQVAEDALVLACKADDLRMMGRAELNMARAHLSLGSFKESRSCAEEAFSLFEMAEDQAGMEEASQIASTAEEDEEAFQAKASTGMGDNVHLETLRVDDVDEDSGCFLAG